MSLSHTPEKLSTIYARTNKEFAKQLSESWLNTNPEWQRKFEKWEVRKYTHLIEAMLIGQMLNPIWTINNDIDDCQDVLDGMHRLTHAILFFTNKLSLGSEFDVLDPEKYKGKKFEDLDATDQDNFRNYQFYINRLDTSYNDDDKRRQMWEKLNSYSKPLKQYEIDKMMLINLYKLITPFTDEIKLTFISPKATDNPKPGQLETDFLTLIALSDKTVPSFSSQNNLYQKWQKITLGKTKSEVDTTIIEKKETLLLISKLIVKYTKLFEEHDLMPEDDDKKTNLILPARIIVSRCVAYIQRSDVFSRHVEELVERFREEVLIQVRDNNLGCTQKNAPFQRKIINTVDAIITEVLKESSEPRLFSKSDIQRKREEQNHVCPLCHKEMKLKQQVEGDHIQPWAAGGKTLYENLQVVHKICHRKKKDVPQPAQTQNLLEPATTT
jgi:5-methylcytosine-specific restriction endonuclease McrA